MSLDESEVYEAHIYAKNYQIGTCFTCQKCLYCVKDLAFEKCLCNKNEKLAKSNRTAKVRGYRGLCYDASSCQPWLKKLMNNSNFKFGYEVNLEPSFFCSLCSACNIVDLTKELQFRISIKNGKETLPSILVNFLLNNMEYINFLIKVEQVVSEHIGLIFKNEYLLAYKGVSESGAETLLDNKNTFGEFLKDCQHYISNNKKIMFKAYTNFETLPNHAIFSMLHSVKVSKISSVELSTNTQLPSSCHIMMMNSNIQNSLLSTPNVIQNPNVI
ncbi:hypothetical protein C1646_772760 [Rhizophagus diaphanus]|nr:hypothetical protein C1646_772760 [Rhizophagus diaphanus] [Rhizophagus sp. MUCL 43196]